MDLAPTIFAPVALALVMAACSSSRPNAETVAPEQASAPSEATSTAAPKTQEPASSPTAAPKGDGDAEAPIKATSKAPSFNEKSFLANKTGVPQGALTVLKSVRMAAGNKDWKALRKTMGKPFTFSHGHDKDPNLAIPYWKASGEDIFSEIVTVIDGPCEKLVDGMGEVYVSCPTRAMLDPDADVPYGGYQAALVAAEGGSWHLVAFVAGD